MAPSVHSSLFRTTSAPDPHRARRRAILRAHPEVARLFGHDPVSLLFVAAFTGAQLGMARALREAPAIVIIGAAYGIGAFLAAGLNSLIHDASHNLVAATRNGNRLAAIIANLPAVTVQAMPFFRYHPWHHGAMGDYRMDVGIPTRTEARWGTGSAARKAVWLALFPLFQLGRTWKFQDGRPAWDRWMLLNTGAQLAANGLILWAWGPMALLYLGLSLWLSVGPHPVGTRVIQEHFFVEDGQETHSYVGPCNLAELNFGHHVEHHDFQSVPWRRLPALRRLAPEFYEPIFTYRSRLRLLAEFLFRPEWHLGRHTVRVRRPRAASHECAAAAGEMDAREDASRDALSTTG